MKLFIFLILFCVNNNLFSKAITIDIFFINNTATVDVMEFGDQLIYRQTKNTASWKDNEGDYGLIECMGNYISKKSEGTTLNNFCKGSNRDNDTFWLTMYRNSKDYEAGVGRSNYVYGTGKFKNYEGVKCLYGVEIINQMTVIKQKCNF